MSNPRPRLPIRLGFAAKFVLFLIVGVVAYLVAAPAIEVGGVSGLSARPVEMVRLDQGWSKELSDRHHHTSQGTKILPLSWFLALEQPVATPLEVGRFASRDYQARFGFNYDDGPTKGDGRDPNQPDLPIGFAIEADFVAKYASPPIDTPTRIVGLTCAACHTGRIDMEVGEGRYKAVLVDGGSAMIRLSSFQQATALALFYTQLLPMRFNRFADEVERLERLMLKGDDPFKPGERRERIKKDLATYIELGLASNDYAKEHKLNPIDAGFSRTDALGLIGNRVFGVLTEENQVVTDAPVNFPHLWDAPWFDWVQYNASIRTPMARNIGEALGVGALINLTDPNSPLYESTVNVKGLHLMENWIGGDKPFTGLRPPRWTDMLQRVFPDDRKRLEELALKPKRVEEGARLYKEHCERCHLPPRVELEKDLASASPKFFTEKDPWSGERFLRLPVVDLSVVGTDLNQALNFYRRVAVTTEPPWKPPRDVGYQYESRWIREGVPREVWSSTISAEEGLFRVTSFVREKNYRSPTFDLLAPPEMTDPAQVKAYNNDPKRRAARMQFDGSRGLPEALDFVREDAVLAGQDMGWVIQKNLGYKARPLEGIWATPPYLHNGSVPNLYQLLVPVASRSPKFYLGSTRFDPLDVGYQVDQIAGSFEMDTSLPGNRNEGHEYRNLTIQEFEDAPWDGRSTLEERWARVLGLSVQELAAKSPDERWGLTRQATIEALRKPRRRGIRGVLGPELKEEERRGLVEYMKSL
jgi:RoxA-like, cytochrome c-like